MKILNPFVSGIFSMHFFLKIRTGTFPGFNFSSLFFLFCALLFLNSDAHAASKPSPAEELYKKAREAFYIMKETGDPSADRKAWLDVASLFRKVYEDFPGSDRSDDAVYTLARIHLDLYKKHENKKDVKQALHYFSKVTEEYPASRLADDALIRIAEIYLHIEKDGAKALKIYQGIFRQYPGGDKAKEAKEMTVSLKKKLRSKKKKVLNLIGVNSIRYRSHPTYTRVVIELAASVAFKEKRLFNPDRIYVDLKNAFIPEDIRNNPIIANDTILKQVRGSQHDSGTGRVVLDVKGFHDYKVSSLHDPFRVVIDLTGKSDGENSKAAAPPQGKKPSVKKKVTGKRSLKRIIIDPGHGGKDRGATGRFNIKEKGVVLDIALRLKKILLANLDYEVLLTREKDIYIPLEERTAFANTANGDIFISIHANSAPRKNAFGIETYYLSNALSERALETASRENMVATKNMSDDLQFILSDMLANSNMRESSELAGIIQENLVQGLKKSYSKVKNLGAKGGPFFVLHGANMPSVLVEVGFLSNSMEAKRIRSPQYRGKLAVSLYRGIKRYLKEFKVAGRSE